MTYFLTYKTRVGYTSKRKLNISDDSFIYYFTPKSRHFLVLLHPDYFSAPVSVLCAMMREDSFVR